MSKYQFFIIYYLSMRQSLLQLILFLLLALYAMASDSSCPRGEIKVSQRCISCKIYRDINLADDIGQQTVWNSCPCKKGYIWSHSKLKCESSKIEWKNNRLSSSSQRQNGALSQKNLKNLGQNTCPYDRGFILYNTSTNSICLNCRSIPFSRGYAYSNNECQCGLYNFQWDGNKCSCAYNFYIDMTNLVCTPCMYLSASLQKDCKQCNFPFVRGNYGCTLSTTLENNGKNISVCAPRFTFDYSLGKCICVKGHILADGKCIACFAYSTDCLNCIKSYVFDGYNCVPLSRLVNADLGLSPSNGCPTGYTYKYDPISNQIISCACSASAFYYQNGNACISCASILPQGLTLADCKGCLATAGFFRGSVDCIYCPGILNAIGTATQYSCDCLPDYYFNANTNKCECDFYEGLINGLDNTCVRCNQIPNIKYLYSVTPIACICSQGFTWNALTFSCDCDISSPYSIVIEGKCIGCSTMFGSSYKVGVDLISCQCASGFYWNNGANMCECDRNQNFVGSISKYGYCASCSYLSKYYYIYQKHPASEYNGLAYNENCVCQNGFIWQPFVCYCYDQMVIDGTKCVSCASLSTSIGINIGDCTQCKIEKGFARKYPNWNCAYCPRQRGATGYNIENGECTCPAGQIWSLELYGCICDWTSGYVTSIFNGSDYKCVKCIYTDLKQQCICGVGPLFMSNIYSICSDCSQDPNSVITADKRCVCRPGYSWSELIYPFRCVPNLSGGSYMDVSTQPPKYPLCSSLKGTLQAFCLACNSSQGFLLLPSIDQCLYCQTIKNATGKVLFNNTCECKAGFQWNPLLYTCDKANCTSGYVYDYIKQVCNICDPTRSITLNGSCFSCKNDPNSYGLAAADMRSCSCKPAFTWVSKACVKIACNISTSIWLGGVCFKCPVSTYSTGAASGNSSCTCIKGYKWISNRTGGDCLCNLFTNYINSNNSCVPCPSTSNSIGVGDGEGGCMCKNNFRWDISGTCICGFNSIGISGYISNGVCIVCFLSSDLNYDGTVKNNTCSCKKGFTAVRSTKGTISCQCLPPGVNVQGQCITCPKNSNSSGNYNTYGSCLCINNYIWSPQKYTCVCDASVSAYLTPNGTCFSCMNFDDPYLSGFVVNGTCQCVNGFTFATTNTGGSCQCAQYQADGICYTCPPNSASDGNGGCTCLNNYVWSSISGCLCDESVSSFLLPDNTCFSCTQATDPNFDGTLMNGICNCVNLFVQSIDSSGVPSCICPLVIYPNGICSVCPQNKVSLGVTDGVGGCLCKNKFTWDPTSMKCICNTATSIVLSNGLCMTCGGFGTNTVSKAGTSSCTCQAGLIWNPDNGICDCGGNSVLWIVGNGYTCIVCSNIATSNAVKISSYECGCTSNVLSWNNATAKCDCGSNAAYYNGNCIDCTSVNFAAGINLGFTPGTCICAFSGATWSDIEVKCICSNPNSVVFVNSDGSFSCQSCDVSISALSSRISYKACSCPNGTFWIDNVGCVCPRSFQAAFYNGNNVICVLCDKSVYAAGVAFGGRNCICMGTLVWNSTSLSCGCNSTSAIATINGRPVCVNCLSLNYASTPVIALTNCTCVSPKLRWYLQGYCGCPNSSVTVVVGPPSNVTCITCNMSINSNGKLSPSSNLCSCASPSIKFNNSVCDCGPGLAFALMYRDQGYYYYFCVSCNNILSLVSGKVNSSTCRCSFSGLVWNSTTGYCQCKDPLMVFRFSQNMLNGSCVACKGRFTGTPIGPTSCSCLVQKMTFYDSTGNCSCYTNHILLPNIICYPCPGGNQLTIYECLCPSNSIWSIFALKCLICGTDIVNSLATGGSALACKCAAGFIWDVMTISCITPCTANNASCMDCSLQQAKGSASPLNAPRKLSDWNTTLSALNGDFTNYNAIKGYQCPCILGYSWDSVRLRCYDNKNF